MFAISPTILYFAKNAIILTYIPLGMSSIALIGLLYLRPNESIKFLMARGRYMEAANEARRIGSFNKLEESVVT